MKNRISIVYVLIFLSIAVKGQIPTYSCILDNESYTSSNEYEFDIYLARTGATPLELASFQAGFTLNSSFLNGGMLTATLVSGTSELLSSQEPVSITFDQSKLNLKIAPRIPPRNYTSGVTSGTIIPTTGLRVCRVRLTNTVSYGTTPLHLVWVFSYAQQQYRTLVSAFVPSSPHAVNTDITNSMFHTRSHSLSVYLEGLYNGTGLSKVLDELGEHFAGPVADEIMVKLVDGAANIVYQDLSVNLLTSGLSTINVPMNLTGTYYLVVNHRNSVETWSTQMLDFTSGDVNYDFTSSVALTYGSNIKSMVNGKYAIYAGDVNQDLYVDGSDLDAVFNESSVGIYQGYRAANVNGDDWVDGSDLDMVFNNSSVGIQAVTPFAKKKH